jgi:hypothetical protein
MDSKEVDEVTRRVSVLVEAVRSDVRIVAEGVSALTGAVAGLGNRIDGLENRVENLEITVKAGFDRVDGKLEETRAMIRS